MLNIHLLKAQCAPGRAYQEEQGLGVLSAENGTKAPGPPRRGTPSMSCSRESSPSAARAAKREGARRVVGAPEVRPGLPNRVWSVGVTSTLNRLQFFRKAELRLWLFLCVIF